jgi:hemerythrin-like metal-binding protein
MSLINWTNNFSVKVDKFDEQHQKLIDILNHLYDSMSNGEGSKVLGQLLKELIDYTQYHFSAEEDAFKRYNYPEESEHRKAHRELLDKALELQEKHASGELSITIDVLNFLNDWVQNHILKMDKNYADFFKDKIV